MSQSHDLPRDDRVSATTLLGWVCLFVFYQWARHKTAAGGLPAVSALEVMEICCIVAIFWRARSSARLSTLECLIALIALPVAAVLAVRPLLAASLVSSAGFVRYAAQPM